MKIHHQTAKKAAKFGIELVVVEGEIEARKDGRTLASHMLGNVALEQAISKMFNEAGTAAGWTLEGVTANPVKVKSARKPAKARDDDEGDDEQDDAKLDNVLEDDEPGDDGEAEEAEEGEGKSIVKRKYKEKYRPFKMTCGDELVALTKKHLLRDNEEGDTNISPVKLKKFAQANGCWDPRYATMNIGMQRMNIGNRLRAKVRRDKHQIVWA